MDILGFPVGFDQLFVTGHVRQDSQFDLGIVRVDKNAAFPRIETFPDPSAEIFAHGYILKVRVCAGQPAGRSDRLVKGRADTAVLLDTGQESVRISRFQF